MRLQTTGVIFAAFMALSATAENTPPALTCANRRTCLGASGAPGVRCGPDGTQIPCTETEWCINVERLTGQDKTAQSVGVCVPKNTQPNDPTILCQNFMQCEPGIDDVPSRRYCTADGVYEHCPPSQYCADVTNGGPKSSYSCQNIPGTGSASLAVKIAIANAEKAAASNKAHS